MSKQSAVEKLQKEAAQLLETASLIERLIPDLPEYCEVWGTERAIRIGIPYNRQYLKELRALLGDDWKFERAWASNENGWRLVTYQHKETKVELIVTLMVFATGATCQRVQVGEKVTPVYEIVCN